MSCGEDRTVVDLPSLAHGAERFSATARSADRRHRHRRSTLAPSAIGAKVSRLRLLQLWFHLARTTRLRGARPARMSQSLTE
jgi:hypothetical protein